MSNVFQGATILKEATDYLGWDFDPADPANSSAARISQGAALPAAADPKGSLYIRTDGVIGVYQAQDGAGTWALQAPVPQDVADPGNAGAIPVTATVGVCAITTAGAETRTVAAPTILGQRLLLVFDVDGGDAVVTVASAFNMAGNTIITYNTAGEYSELVAGQVAGALRWRITANDGGVLS